MHRRFVLATVLLLIALVGARLVTSAFATDDPLPDRTDCDAIRGTDFRSDTEQVWFEANCPDSNDTSQSTPPASPPVDTSSSTSSQPPNAAPTPTRQIVSASGSDG